MTEPPRPPGAAGSGDDAADPTTPYSPSAPYPGADPHGAPSGTNPPPGGYPPPGAGGGYPPPGGPGYPPGGGYPAGPPAGGYPSQDDRTWSLIAHFGGPVGVVVGAFLLGWVAPLIALMTRGQQSPVVRAHAVAALNFQITWAAVSLAGWVATAITCGLLVFIPLLTWLVPVIFGIIGGVKANEGQLYRYPVSYAFLKR
ncbi:DUF4870 domain-containing protein [Plantactinospora sp. KBS50]|uniref:DUF4870 domain-containing protein n=1 Tax=Plantactinospora sp. KBS50 TaxID=2024580 RepID=UPI000BAAEF18|nr:DUF4870 domain-containing protein [Plantactinospora sp. KBS50]ASW56260.1 hypothetical protein CIK06_22020 [Plantactinospora sp. KBS50]